MENNLESNRALEEIRELSFSIWKELRADLSNEKLMSLYISTLRTCEKLQAEINCK